MPAAQRPCPRPLCALGLGALVAEVLVFVAYERAASQAGGASLHASSARERSLEERLRNATAVSQALSAALRGAQAELEELRREHGGQVPAATGSGKAEAHAVPPTSSPTTLLPADAGASHAASARQPDPEAEIRHAPLGECGGARPRGLLQNECRWAWDEVPRPRLIVEFGGNQGDDLKHFADLHPEAIIHSFEPVRKYFNVLWRNFRRHKRVRLHQIGASDADAKVTFRTDGDAAAASEFGTAKGDSTPVYEDVSLRDAHKLLQDIVLKEGRDIDVLSINCEGCEYAILERLSATGWFSKLQYLQVSWHTSSQIPRRLERRCKLLGELRAHLRPAYQADFAWEGYASSPRLYAVDARYLSSAEYVHVGKSNGIGQAQGGLECPSDPKAEPPAGAGKLEVGEDPETGHLTYPQTMQGDLVTNFLLGSALALPAAERRPLVVEVGAGDGAGVRFRHAMAKNLGARVHSFEPVDSLRRRLEADAQAMNLTEGGRAVWPQGWAAEDGMARFRAWGPGPDGTSARWEGHWEEGELWDAGRALKAVADQEGRSPDLLYLNCEGCEYDVIQRLADTGWLASLPRLAVSWHAGGAPWARRCGLEALLRRGHRLSASAESWELWLLEGLEGQA